ncbi:MAG: glycosyltransferase family 2 protein [Alphaproteobacteria bacterium]|nr:glycosyltransferase family 2 protein [Alphaproteobacteria bacterium]
MISVIIPVYNGEKYLDECLSSVQHDNVEIVVVLDGCTDNSKNIAIKYKDKIIIHETNMGPVVARNNGIKSATGDYIMFMDADDVLNQNAYDILLENINGFDGVIGLRSDFVSPEYNIPVETKTSSHGVIAGCALFTKSAFEENGLFDEELLCGDGYDWLLRAEKSGLKFNKINSVLCNRRIHESNMGRNLKEREYSDYAKIIKKHFTRK